MSPEEFLNAFDDLDLEPLGNVLRQLDQTWCYKCIAEEGCIHDLSELAKAVRADNPIQFITLSEPGGVVHCDTYKNDRISLRHVRHDGAQRFDVVYRKMEEVAE